MFGFLDALPLVTYRNHLILFLLSAFGDPLPHPLRTSYMEAPLCEITGKWHVLNDPLQQSGNKADGPRTSAHSVFRQISAQSQNLKALLSSSVLYPPSGTAAAAKALPQSSRGAALSSKKRLDGNCGSADGRGRR